MTKPITIPRNLKPGDRLWYSKTEFATVRNRTDDDTPYWDGRIAAKTEDNHSLIYHANGTEWSNDTPPIIRIERITSAGDAKPCVPASESWCQKLTRLINICAESIPGKAFDPDWFVLWQHIALAKDFNPADAAKPDADDAGFVSAPCGICGEPVRRGRHGSFAEYHDCKPVPRAMLDKALTELAEAKAELHQHYTTENELNAVKVSLAAATERAEKAEHRIELFMNECIFVHKERDAANASTRTAVAERDAARADKPSRGELSLRARTDAALAAHDAARKGA